MKPNKLASCFSTFLLLICFLRSSHLFGQTDPLHRIADDVVAATTFEIPATDKPPQPTRYNLWMYQNFMIMEGMDALGDVTGKEVYQKYAGRNIDFFGDYQATFGDSMSAGPAGKGKWYTKPREMWHCGMIAAVAERQKTHPRQEFVKGMKTFDSLIEKSPKFFRDGVLVRKKSKGRGLGLQIDDLYMISPYWCRKSELLNDDKWLERAIDESLIYFDYLWDDEDKLMHCLWLGKDQAPYGLYWGRGNGWYIMAITDLLSFVPNDHEKRDELLKDYRMFMEGIISRQGKNGLWHQIIDHPETYEETSSSGMFTYCILKGVNEGWLDARYLSAGKKGWEGLLTKVNDKFEITNVCPPSDISTKVEFYSKGKAPVTHDQHAIGPFLLAGAAYLRTNKLEIENK